jgi:hypothetical protein
VGLAVTDRDDTRQGASDADGWQTARAECC